MNTVNSNLIKHSINSIIRDSLIFLLHKTARIWPDRIYLKLLFRIMMGQKLDLKNPMSFNQKLQWLKLFDRKQEYTQMVDKYAVKQYVAAKIGEEFIIPTLGIWDTIDEIEWNKLPNQFVLKTTNGGGGFGVVICKDKTSLNIKSVKKKLTQSLKNDIYSFYREWPYKNVPKRIIAEKYMVDESGEELKDYKFFCFNGRVEYFKIDFNRFVSHKANYYDRNAYLLPFEEVNCPADHTKIFDKPQNLNLMIELAECLAKDIPLVRIDFYDVAGRVYFGEITFYPASGLGQFKPVEWDYKLGSKINLFN